ncbi:MAG TPA: branched-chain amino acid ABC transporter permease [Nitrospirae bacterium]|nr:branched-chain amino acid ABC transporter permease [Nitrospirota bacterium]HDZ03387.1 branched-chain amino acid ABC transporter permease [Nitrospirota bacterium]
MDLITQLVINSIIAGAIYTLIALGFNLVYGATKFFNIAHGVFAAIGGYTVYFLFRISGINLFLSVFAGILLAGISGMLSDRIIFLPLRKKGGSNVIMLVASIGLFTVLQAVIAILFGNRFQSLTEIFNAQRTYKISSGVITGLHIVIIITVIFLTAGLLLMLNKTKFGKAVKAISDDEEVAGIVGINTDRIIGYVFFIGSAIAGLGGILIGFDTGIMPTMGMGLLLKGVIASIVGGVGNVYGGVLGAFLLGFVENFGVWKIAGEWKDAIAFGMLIIFLLFRPQGILGK